MDAGSFDHAGLELLQLLFVIGPHPYEQVACGPCFLLVDLEIANPTWISTQSPGTTPSPSSASSRPMLTLRRTPATSTLAKRRSSSTISTTCPGIAKHTRRVLPASSRARGRYVTRVTAGGGNDNHPSLVAQDRSRLTSDRRDDGDGC